MSRLLRCCCALALAVFAAALPCWTQEPPAHRVEARSAALLAVALVQGNHMSIHLSRLLDNAPVRDAAVSVVLRGARLPAVAEADGSYALESGELAVPGSAAVEFEVLRGESREVLTGTLQIADKPVEGADKNNARQLWWWVLNFAVCTGFLVLWSKRRKAAPED